MVLYKHILLILLWRCVFKENYLQLTKKHIPRILYERNFCLFEGLATAPKKIIVDTKLCNAQSLQFVLTIHLYIVSNIAFSSKAI